MKNDEQKINRLNLNVDLNLLNAAQVFHKNLKDTGCAVLKNHNVSLHLIDEMLEQWKKYFSNDKKFDWLRTEQNDEGYIPLNVEMARKGEMPDYKELYQAHYNVPLPSIIDTSTTSQLFTELVKVGEKLCGLIDISMPSQIKEKMSMPLLEMVKESNNHMLRIIHYPPIKKGVRIPRSTIHTDICLLTIVFGSKFGGLTFHDSNGEPFVPIVSDDVLVVFTSDMLMYGTGNYFDGTLHSVKANPNHHTHSRYSIVYAIHPRRGVNLWHGKTAGEYLKDRLNSMGYNGDLLDLRDN